MEHFTEILAKHQILSLLGFIVILLIVAFLSDRLGQWSRDRRDARELTALRTSVQEHINQLPIIQKDYLLKHEGEVWLRSVRSFGTRNDSVVIYDEFGQKWYGRKTAELIDQLIAAEYTLDDSYFINFCGPGEIAQGEIMEINGTFIDSYPTYLLNKSVTGPEWWQWLKIELNYEQSRKEGRRPKSYYDHIDHSAVEAWVQTKKMVGPVVPQI